MSTLNDTIQFMNSDTYLNHLPPSGARSYEVCRNVTLIVLGITIWDILVYIPDDFAIVKRSRVRFPVICFICARVFAASYTLCSIIQLTTPLENQARLLYIALAFCALAVGSSSFLFLRRVHAIYMGNSWIWWFFSILWLAHIACEASFFIGMAPRDIPGTLRFQDNGAKPSLTASMYGIVAFDTCVFLAISYRMGTTYTADEHNRWDTIVSGKALPRLSRAILQGGQQYYLFTVAMMITAVTLLLIPSVDPIIKGTVVIPLVPLSASMACRVFRNIKQFDYWHTTSLNLPVSQLHD